MAKRFFSILTSTVYSAASEYPSPAARKCLPVHWSGYARGTEPVAYVDSIMARWET